MTGDAVDEHHYRAFLLCPTGFGAQGPPARLASAPNARAMAGFLSERNWGVCAQEDIVTMADEPAPQVRIRLREWITSAGPGEVLVFVYSGRGVGADGRTLLATATVNDPIGADEIADWVRESAAAAVYVIIDADHTDARQLFHDDDRVVVIAANDALVELNVGPASPSVFTSTLLEALTRERTPTGESVFRDLDAVTRRTAGDDVDQPVVRVAPGRNLADAPLRRVAPRSRAAGSPALAWIALAVLGLVALVAFGVIASGDDDADGVTQSLPAVGSLAPVTEVVSPTLPVATTTPRPTASTDPPTTTAPSSTTPISAAPTSTTPESTVPESTVPPPASLADVDLGVSAPIADPACDGSWIVQIGATDATADAAAAIVGDALAVSGSSYTFTQASCSSFNQSAAFYVVFLGPFASESAARDACDDYVVSDPSTRQCFALQLS